MAVDLRKATENVVKRQRLDEVGAVLASVSDNSCVADIPHCNEWGDSMAFPTDLPMETRYHQLVFYVRECYPVYYRMVLRLLKRNVEAVTVTGTTGIGMSLFYAYFFKRYSAENEHVTVITASFDNDSTMTKVVVWRRGVQIARAKNKFLMEDVIERAEQDAKDGFIHLYDGPPTACPDAQMVCFTSPNGKWFGKLKMNYMRPKIIMPLWDLEELQTAAEEVNLTLSAPLTNETQMNQEQEPTVVPNPTGPVVVANLVEERFGVFGGVARECLSTDESFVKQRQLVIEDTIAKFNDATYLRSVLETTEDKGAHHCICHYVPDPANPQFQHTIAEPTTFVKRLLMQRLSDVVTDTRNAIIRCLRDATAAASFRGTLFEIGVHEKLNSGCTLTAHRLNGGDSTQSKIFKCEKSIPAKAGEFYCYFDNNFSAYVLSHGPYHVPSAKNFGTIDSFYYPKPSSTTNSGLLLLFRITVARSHPVNGEGLAKTLEQLGLLEAVQHNPEMTALIFVVPKGNISSFGSQKIELDLSTDEDSVGKLTQIGEKREEALRNVGIVTIGDLRTRLVMEEENNTSVTTKIAKNLSVRTLRRLLTQRDEQQKWSGLKRTFDAIPQFVWGAELHSRYL